MQNICKMRYKCKKEQSKSIFLYIFSIMISLCYKIAHNRASKPSDNMHNNRQRFPRITGKKHPRNMVNRHSDNCNYFKLIRIKQFIFRHIYNTEMILSSSRCQNSIIGAIKILIYALFHFILIKGKRFVYCVLTGRFKRLQNTEHMRQSFAVFLTVICKFTRNAVLF